MQFGSDNQSGAAQQVLDTLISANTGFTHGYGDDHWCDLAKEALMQMFNCDLDVFFVATGTAANSLALSCLVQPWETILCHHQAHILLDESTAPEFFSGGARLVPITQHAGKLELRHLKYFFNSESPQIPHTPAVKALSITQTNEAGQVYSIKELSELISCAHGHNLHVHMDGARFANAVAALGCSPADITWKAGVDVLTLGATKCGALAAEAVIFFKREQAVNFIHRRKRSGHLISKGRFLGAQFVGWLKDDYWLALAKHANNQAQLLEKRLATYHNIKQIRKCHANEIFLIMPGELADSLQTAGAAFYQWPVLSLPKNISLDKKEVFVRLVTSFATTNEHISEFCNNIGRFTENG
jgi:threonine aldolase